jgi:hypothetical protein
MSSILSASLMYLLLAPRFLPRGLPDCPLMNGIANYLDIIGFGCISVTPDLIAHCTNP